MLVGTSEYVDCAAFAPVARETVIVQLPAVPAFDDVIPLDVYQRLALLLHSHALNLRSA